MWLYSNTQIVTKLKNSNCDKTPKPKLWQKSKLNLWQNLIYDKTLKDPFSKNSLKAWQPLRCTPGSVLQFRNVFNSKRKYTDMIAASPCYFLWLVRTKDYKWFLDCELCTAWNMTTIKYFDLLSFASALPSQI